jgi:2-polyprenyl-3-methyl-5-hydroxy-6-metoxy-1,4-benzoquinol methylase
MSIPAQRNIRDEFRLGRRFRFGKNWQRFLATIDESSIQEAERHLKEFLGVSSLINKRFLDVGSGSGLHSLVACRLGASVVAFDYDPDSVEASLRLRSKFGFEEDTWKVEVGSVLDDHYLSSLGKFDIVYAWGVLHHTGAMWQALEKVQSLVKNSGRLYIAIYNDAGETSRLWLQRKRIYCGLPLALKLLYFLWVYTPIELGKMSVSKSLKKGRIDRLPKKFTKCPGQWKYYKKHRGMSRIHDMVDWIGGYPYEFAKAEALVSFCEKAGFQLEKLVRNDGTGNHELVFVKRAAPP